MLKIPFHESRIAEFQKKQQELEQELGLAPPADPDPTHEQPSDLALDPLADPIPQPVAEQAPVPRPMLELDEPDENLLLEILQPAQAADNPVVGMRTTLSVQVADPAGPHCRYTWSVVSKPPDAALPIFSVNGSRNARETNVRFYRAGQYVLRVTMTMADQTITSDVAVQVEKKTT
jgi:hypothetical protein